MTIDDFIKELQAISEDKRKLPLVMYAPNGTECRPRVVMQLKEGTFLFNPVVEKMVVTWQH